MEEKSSAYRFRLLSFAVGPVPKGLEISGSLVRQPGQLQIEYRLSGDLDRLIMPGPSLAAARRHELWRQTCLEVFFGIPGESAYWEGNFSPCGNWNVYRFSDYRQGMREEKAVARPVCRQVMEGGEQLFSRTLDIHKICGDSSDLEIGISCVLKDVHGVFSYWAIAHRGLKPDFHDRRSFLLKVAAPDASIILPSSPAGPGPAPTGKSL
jgi:hypothetical protein